MYYQLLVYSGRTHYHKPIDELSVIFCTKEEAENEKRILEKLRPKYYTEIIEVK